MEMFSGASARAAARCWRLVISVSAGILLATAAVAPANAQSARDTPPKKGNANAGYTFQLCNNTSTRSISIAMGIFRDPDDDHVTVEGWWSLDRDDCMSFNGSFGDYTDMYIYYHGERGDLTWGRDTELCVRDDSFTRKGSDNYKCKSNERLVKFTSVKIDKGDPQPVVWSLTDPK